MPTGEQICEKQLFNLVDQIEKVKVNEEEIAGLMPSIYRKLEWLDKEDIIKRMVSLEFNRMIDYYKDADDIEVVDEQLHVLVSARRIDNDAAALSVALLRITRHLSDGCLLSAREDSCPPLHICAL